MHSAGEPMRIDRKIRRTARQNRNGLSYIRFVLIEEFFFSPPLQSLLTL
jgi:hypothetical protein